jgi:hypothetical protein
MEPVLLVGRSSVDHDWTRVARIEVDRVVQFKAKVMFADV